MGRLSDLLLGVSTEREGLYRLQTVGTGGARLAPSNPNRVNLVLINQGGNDAFVLDDPTVAANEGFLLASDGGVLTLQTDTDGDLTTQEFHAVTDAGTTDIFARGEEVSGPIPEVGPDA